MNHAMALRSWILGGVLALVCACTGSNGSDEVVCGAPCVGSSGTCVEGRCACPAWFTSCGTFCADLTADVANCGACGNACDGGACVGGKCAASCPWPMCGTLCVDINTSPAHCGKCGNACAAGTSCKSGTCVPDSAPPPTGCTGATVPCNGGCVNTGTDPNNCGTCGHKCPDNGSGCAGGVCACPSPWTYCPSDNYCWNLAKSEAHCGSCAIACGGGHLCCDAICKDIMWGEKNCGSCTGVCGTGKVCCRGACVVKGTCP